MARAHEPPNGSDHPPQNGNRGKQVAIALFLATTFGVMAILSFPLSEVGRLPFRIQRPLQAALAPAERLLRPIIPWLGSLGPRPSRPAANPPASAGNPPSVPSGPTGPGGPGEGPPQPPPPPPRGGGDSPTLGRVARPRSLAPSTLTRELTTLLSTLTKKLTTREARLVRAELGWIRPVRDVCLADRACAKQLQKLEKLLLKYQAHQRGKHEGKHPHGSGKQGKHKKHGKRHQGLSKWHASTKG
jgi:hypothetical protein